MGFRAAALGVGVAQDTAARRYGGRGVWSAGGALCTLKHFVGNAQVRSFSYEFPARTKNPKSLKITSRIRCRTAKTTIMPRHAPSYPPGQKYPAAAPSGKNKSPHLNDKKPVISWIANTARLTMVATKSSFEKCRKNATIPTSAQPR